MGDTDAEHTLTELVDGFDDAIVGRVEYAVVYDYDKYVKILMDRHKMSYKDAIGHIFTVYVGENAHS
jgi:hypothetical protein